MLATTAAASFAHTGQGDPIPDVPGETRVGLAAAGAWLRANDPLPSQRLPGFLLLGDPGIDRRGTRLEHAVAQIGHRLTEHLGGYLALGKHDEDPVHVEAAWLQARGSVGDVGWTFGLGRERPALGPVMTLAGHLDRFGAMPLAKHAVTDGDWIENGAALGATGHAGPLAWTLDVGVWAARAFPGDRSASPAPSLHAGTRWTGAGGEWSVDGFMAWLAPSARGSRTVSTTGAHSHVAPRCDDALVDVVCFDGRSRISGLSVQWAADTLPLTVAAAVMWRDESGSLASRNGLARYEGSTRGDWIQALWRLPADWEAGIRHERLAATQSIVGAGASLLASETGLNGYAPQRRTTLKLSRALATWIEAGLEVGEEHAGSVSSRFVSLRVLARWDRTF
jgi:hypothetical protein